MRFYFLFRLRLLCPIISITCTRPSIKKKNKKNIAHPRKNTHPGLYTQAIAGAPADHTLYGNRCLARLKLADATAPAAAAAAAASTETGGEGKENKKASGGGGSNGRAMLLEAALADAEKAIEVCLYINWCVVFFGGGGVWGWAYIYIYLFTYNHTHIYIQIHPPPITTPKRTHTNIHTYTHIHIPPHQHDSWTPRGPRGTTARGARFLRWAGGRRRGRIWPSAWHMHACVYLRIIFLCVDMCISIYTMNDPRTHIIYIYTHTHSIYIN